MSAPCWTWMRYGTWTTWTSEARIHPMAPLGRMGSSRGRGRRGRHRRPRRGRLARDAAGERHARSSLLAAHQRGECQDHHYEPEPIGEVSNGHGAVFGDGGAEMKAPARER